MVIRGIKDQDAEETGVVRFFQLDGSWQTEVDKLSEVVRI
jgi:hypothetical protein